MIFWIGDPPAGLSPEATEQWRIEAEAKAKEEHDSQTTPLALQAWDWNAAIAVVVVRVEAAHKIQKARAPGSRIMETVEAVDLMTLNWLKGRGETRTFQLSYDSYWDCGPSPGWNVIAGKPGQEFVLFLDGWEPSQQTVTKSWNTTAIVEPRIREAMGFPQ
ncbi:MAG: hypothetical protein EON93_19410 [Burkholderiales bacterium]|nr:MAG: hypothetical protein EON93_19410 [Burkholderiales bacterium]